MAALASGLMRLRISRAALGDLALVAVSLALTELEIWDSNDVPGPRVGRALPLLLLLVLPILLRRTAPLLAAALVSFGIVAYSVWRGSPEGVELIVPMVVVTYSVAAHAGRRRAIVGPRRRLPPVTRSTRPTTRTSPSAAREPRRTSGLLRSSA